MDINDFGRGRLATRLESKMATYGHHGTQVDIFDSNIR